ncbi:MAG: hypothetical protein FJY56_18465 [Betaproteobacteria bacterium]|nr:hypothetical protein [Betaproteobacteria bacterium]
MYASYDDARRRGRISQGEAQRFAAMDSRLIALRNELAGEGISLQDYQRIGSLIARDRATVEQMSRY